MVCVLVYSVIAKQSILPAALDCFASLAMTLGPSPLIQLLDRHRDALPDADAHGRQRAFSAALLHAMHRGHREARTAHAQGMTERDGAAIRVDEIGIVLDAELAQAGYSLAGERFVELDQIE